MSIHNCQRLACVQTFALRLTTIVVLALLALYNSHNPVYAQSYLSMFEGMPLMIVQFVIALLLLVGLVHKPTGIVGDLTLGAWAIVNLSLIPLAKMVGYFPLFLKDVWLVGIALVLLQRDLNLSLKGVIAGIPTLILRLSVILIFVAFSLSKWTMAGANALVPNYVGGTWLEVLPNSIGVYPFSLFLGVFETLAFLGLIIGIIKPKFGVLGALLVLCTGVVTVSLLPQRGINPFIAKDLLIIGAAIHLFIYDLQRACGGACPLSNAKASTTLAEDDSKDADNVEVSSEIKTATSTETATKTPAQSSENSQ